MKRKALILFAAAICAVVVLAMPMTTVFAAKVNNVVWSGAMNYNDANNAVYAKGGSAPTSVYYTREKWYARINDMTSTWGVYSGQTVIVGDEIYITGAKKDDATGKYVPVLKKINKNTGAEVTSLEGVGSCNTSTSIYYDYLTMDADDGLLFVTGTNKIEVIDVLNFTKLAEYACTDLGLARNAFGSYHPTQYKAGYLICNGLSLKINAAPADGEKYLTAVNTLTFGTTTETADDKTTTYKKNFAWSSGAFVGDLFYVTCTDTASASATYGHVLLLAVDYKTGEVKHVFDAGKASDYASDSTTNKKINAYNTTGQTVYDAASGYLYWSNRFCKYLFGVHVESDGSFSAEMKTALLSRNTGTVCAPVIYNGRLYIAGQGEGWGQGGDICVVDVNAKSANFMKEIYATQTGVYKVQSNPILQYDDSTKTAYVYVQSYVAPGYIFVLTDTPSTTSANMALLATPSKGQAVALDAGVVSGGAYAYEQIAIDADGRIYAYNEEGYLFCFEKAEITVPQITTDLSSARVKYALGSTAEPLKIEATLGGHDGVLSYKWQSSTDGENWSDIDGATTSSYVPSTQSESTVYYRCVVINTVGGKSVEVASSAAWIYTKVFSSETDISVVSSTSNNISSNAAKITANGDFFVVCNVEKPRVWFAPVYAEATIEQGEVVYGTGEPSWATPTSANNYDGTAYCYRAYWSTTPDLVLYRIKVIAEDGTTAYKYVLVCNDESLATVKFACNIDASDIALELNETADVEYTFDTVGGAVDETVARVSFVSSDETVATVDDDGKVTAVGTGVAYITVTRGYATATVTVSVAISLIDISLPQSAEVELGETYQLTVTFNPENTTDDKTVVWSSLDSTVATVDENGKVTAVGKGNVVVKAQAGDFVATCLITVTTSKMDAFDAAVKSLDDTDKQKEYESIVSALKAYDAMTEAEKVLSADDYAALTARVEQYNAWVDKANGEQSSVLAVLGGVVSGLLMLAAAAVVINKR